MKKRLLFFVLVLASPLEGTIISPFTLDFSASGGSSGLAGNTIAGGLNFPYGLARLPDGSLLYGPSLPLPRLGSQDDNHKTTATATVAGAGLAATQINGDSIYRVTVNTAGSSVRVITQPVQVATGFRNAYGLALDPLGNLFAGRQRHRWGPRTRSTSR